MMMAGAAAALLLVVVLVVVLETGYRIWDLLQHPISARFAFALPLPLPRSRSAPRSLPQSGVCWFVWYTARGGSSKKNRGELVREQVQVVSLAGICRGAAGGDGGGVEG
jgi:hypothetical protein